MHSSPDTLVFLSKILLKFERG